MTPSPLRIAHDDLTARREAADRMADAGDPAMGVLARELGLLEDIVDHARRIDENTDSAHYRAEKAAPLTDAALRLEALAVELYCHQDGVAAAPMTPVVEQFVDESTQALFDEALDHTSKLIGATRDLMWDVARYGRPSETSAQALRQVCGGLTRWATESTARSIPDRELNR